MSHDFKYIVFDDHQKMIDGIIDTWTKFHTEEKQKLEARIAELEKQLSDSNWTVQKLKHQIINP